MDKITQRDLDALADILWWIKGYRAADYSGCPFADIHVAALDKAHDNLRAVMKKSTDECRPMNPLEKI
jgi:hypothetical protein